jgi:hypothetical protein
MSFQVVIRQRPEGAALELVKVEYDNDRLQLKLIKALPDVMSINGAALSVAQKRALRAIGTAWQMTDLQPTSDGAVRVSIRREGHIRTLLIGLDGKGGFVDGHGDRVQVAKADPLALSGWS